ncbi:hypothetical protein [Spirosoma pomorum]
MADLNTTYHPYIQKFDYPAIRAELLYDFFPDDSPVKQNMAKFLAELQQSDSQQTITANAVSVAYSGSTAADRQEWLRARIAAVYARLDVIRGFVEGYKAQIIAAGGEPPADPLKTIATVLALIPITAPVGAAATLIAKLVNNDKANQQYRDQKIQEASTALSGFAQDAAQLQAIQSQLVSELGKAPDKKNPNDPNYEAPFVIPTWWYYVGAAVLLLLLVWLRRRNLNRSRR